MSVGLEHKSRAKRPNIVELPACPPRIREIVHGILADEGASWTKVSSPCRAVRLVAIRNKIAMELIRQTTWSYDRIGRFLNRDHTTILKNLRRRYGRIDCRTNHKLTEDDVRAIRQRNNEPKRVVAADYNITHDYVVRIWSRRVWQSLD